jgi:hypothetical protein
MAGTRIERFVYATLALGTVGLVALAFISELGPSSIDPALAGLVPADTVVLAGLRVEALRTAPIWHNLVASKSAAPGGRFDLDELARETGFDPRRDITEVLLAWNGRHFVLLGRGSFQRETVEAKLEREGLKRMPYQGLTLLGDEGGAVAFLSASIAVAGSTPLVRSVLDQRGRSGIAPKALLEQAKSIAADNQVWAVSLGGFDQASRAVLQAGNPGNMAKAVELVERASFGVDLRSGLNATAVIVCRSEQDARTLSDAVRDLLGAARLRTPDSEPDMLRAYDGIQVSLEQRGVRLRVQIARELLEKLLAKLYAGTAAPNPLFRHPEVWRAQRWLALALSDSST